MAGRGPRRRGTRRLRRRCDMRPSSGSLTSDAGWDRAAAQTSRTLHVFLMNLPADCTFCAIVRGDLAAHVVLDDGPFFAFLDRRPLFHGHVLLVPREHV